MLRMVNKKLKRRRAIIATRAAVLMCALLCVCIFNSVTLVYWAGRISDATQGFSLGTNRGQVTVGDWQYQAVVLPPVVNPPPSFGPNLPSPQDLGYQNGYPDGYVVEYSGSYYYARWNPGTVDIPGTSNKWVLIESFTVITTPPVWNNSVHYDYNMRPIYVSHNGQIWQLATWYNNTEPTSGNPIWTLDATGLGRTATDAYAVFTIENNHIVLWKRRSNNPQWTNQLPTSGCTDWIPY